MRTQRRRRAFAAFCVIATVAGSAYAQLAVTSPTAMTNGSIPQNQPGRVVFSIRNTSTSSIDIMGFAPQGTGPSCVGVAIGRIDNAASQAATLAPNQQQQFVAETATGFSFSPADCTWDISTTVGTFNVTTSFITSSLAGSGEVQPTTMDFGSQFLGNTETQSVVVSGYGSGGSGYAMISDASNRFTFDTNVCGAGNTHMCPLTIPTLPNTLTLPVICDPLQATGTPASVSVYGMGSGGSGSGSQLLGQVTLQNCFGGNAIQIENAPITILTMQGQVGAGSAHVISMSGTGNLDGASLVSADPSFQFNSVGCTGTTCNPGSALPTDLTIECTGGATSTTATLTVYGSGVGSDVGQVTCVSMGSTGSLGAMPNPLDFAQVDVSSSVPLPLTLFNAGGSPVTGVYVTPPSDAANWSVSGCPLSAPCTIGAGSSQDVTVTFHPTTHGDLSTTLSVAADPPLLPFLVQLDGMGMGGVMSITEPAGPPYELDFGTIPRGQPFTRTLTISNIGNKTFGASVTGDSAPYTITPAASQMIAPGTPQDYTVTCESTTPSAAFDRTLTVTSNAYQGSNATVSLKCAVADTLVQVAPQQFDFGEVRTGSSRRELMVTVTNPAAATVPAHVSSIQLREPRTGLSVGPAIDKMLQPGEGVSATLVLTTETDSDLTGEFLDVTVDVAMLSLPVTGKVVTAKSRLEPSAIDLGTACIGSMVSADVELFNEGTATLQVSRPMVDTDFVASVPGSMSFPSALPPMMSLPATVEPTMTTAGPLAGTLTWDDDVPSNYSIPVKLEYLTSGTAISPALLDFGSVAVDNEAAALPKSVTIENCDLNSTTLTIKAIRTQNSPVGAWVLEPRLGYTKTLPPHERQAITVRFRPPARGRYEADLEVETSVGPKRIHIRGDATGRDFDNTTFYACACDTPISPSRGWPILAAVVFVIFRRRRAPSSPR